MKRLNQSRVSNNVGNVFTSSQSNNDYATVKIFRNPYYNILRPQPKQPEMSEMEGEGFREIISSIYNKGKEGVQYLYKNRGKIADAYSGEIGTALKNLAPSSDDTARPSFVGEQHGILQLPNGKYGMANYMGPNTNLLERLRRGDPPRTEVDKASQAHDIRYALAKSADDIRKADNIMLNTVDRISRNRGDNIKNIAQARLIKAKVISEDLGLLRKDAFSGDLANKEIPDKDRVTLMSKIGSLAFEGYGHKLLPGDALKMKLLKQMTKQKKMKGRGKCGCGVSGDRDLGQPYKLSGNGGMMDFVVGNIIPNLMKQVGIPSNIVPMSFLKNIIGKSMNLVKDGNMTSIIEHLSKTILPLLVNLKSKSMGGSGSIMTAGYGRKRGKLIKSLSRGLMASFKHYIKSKNRKNMNKQSGSGLLLSGQGNKNWQDFKKGFLSVFKPGAKILGGITSALGMPEFGIPLGILADAL